ncbi:hypothetical protein HID58_042786 [Brassica napus]|uniref:RNase H type-1 domain-containing protein n=1 Tax=Brassica napus TaxID=3708 RepID=A0ABQ8BEV9_BRANA|nr:hypothetical protein HID58_042786 [Brassica napus]
MDEMIETMRQVWRVYNRVRGGQAVIEFEYEKLTKRCFHCLPLTHERPDCPYLREKVRPVFKEVVVSSNGRASNLKDPVGTVPPPGHAVPPGFSPMFPQLAEEERNAALQYVSHSDPTESQARIMRVQQSITDKGAVGARQMPLISHNLKKGKGHVFGYERQRKIGGDVFCSSKYMPFKLSTGLVVSCGADDLEVSSSSSPVGPTVFRIGSSTINHPTGTKSDGKKSRRRPQRWKRLSQTKACVAGDGDGLAGTDDALKKSALVIHGEDTVASAGFSKRKAVSFSLENEDSSRGRFYFDKRMIGKAGFEEAVRRGWQGSDNSADIAAEEWRHANIRDPSTSSKPPVSSFRNRSSQSWQPPPSRVLKCNIGVSWNEAQSISGASWLLRDHNGAVLLHSRRAFSGVSSHMEAELLGFHFAVESMRSTHQRNIIFESHYTLACDALLNPSMFPRLRLVINEVLSFIPCLQTWQMTYACEAQNRPATKIAESVVCDRRFSSYIARGGPSWLLAHLNAEAVSN